MAVNDLQAGALAVHAYNNRSMIAHLRGTLLSKTPGSCIVECAGVGYEVAISIPTFTALPEPFVSAAAAFMPDAPASSPQASLVALHVYTQVREDTLALFGFAALSEKRLFERLITVSGVGPRLGLTILSGLLPEQIVTAIRAQDHAMLTRIPGVGKRLAERLAVELKEKLDDLATPAPAARSGAPSSPAAEDVLSALVNLGYARAAAQKALDTAITRDPSASGSFDALFRATLVLIR